MAVARALNARPDIIFADEPTGNLDSRSSAEILDFMQRAVRQYGQTIVMVTHDPSAASYADRVVFLNDGRIDDELLDPTADAVLNRMKRRRAVTGSSERIFDTNRSSLRLIGHRDRLSTDAVHQ